MRNVPTIFHRSFGAACAANRLASPAEWPWPQEESESLRSGLRQVRHYLAPCIVRVARPSLVSRDRMEELQQHPAAENLRLLLRRHTERSGKTGPAISGLEVRTSECAICKVGCTVDLGTLSETRNEASYRVLPDWDTTDYAVRSWILMRNRHHLFVQEYFADRPHDLLIVNFVSDPSAGTRVANFLGFPGNFDRPVENVNPNKQIPASHAEMLSRSVNRTRHTGARVEVRHLLS